MWNVNGVDDVAFDNCLPGDFYPVTVTVFDRTGSVSDTKSFNCQGNG